MPLQDFGCTLPCKHCSAFVGTAGHRAFSQPNLTSHDGFPPRISPVHRRPPNPPTHPDFVLGLTPFLDQLVETLGIQ